MGVKPVPSAFESVGPVSIELEAAADRPRKRQHRVRRVEVCGDAAGTADRRVVQKLRIVVDPAQQADGEHRSWGDALLGLKVRIWPYLIEDVGSPASLVVATDRVSVVVEVVGASAAQASRAAGARVKPVHAASAAVGAPARTRVVVGIDVRVVCEAVVRHGVVAGVKDHLLNLRIFVAVDVKILIADCNVSVHIDGDGTRGVLVGIDS